MRNGECLVSVAVLSERYSGGVDVIGFQDVFVMLAAAIDTGHDEDYDQQKQDGANDNGSDDAGL